jgi:hypothetical protein
MYLNIALIDIDIEPKYRIYSFSLCSVEVMHGGYPSLLLVQFNNGHWNLDLAYLNWPLRWLLRKLVG